MGSTEEKLRCPGGNPSYVCSGDGHTAAIMLQFSLREICCFDKLLQRLRIVKR
jgi:hypothetical protein